LYPHAARRSKRLSVPALRLLTSTRLARYGTIQKYMKLLHTADWHLGDRLGCIDRTEDLARALQSVADLCARERVDVLIVAGDLFSGTTRLDRLRTAVAQVQNTFAPFLLNGGTILAVTGNHDNEHFCQILRQTMSLAAPASDQPGRLLPPGRLYLTPEPTFFRLADRQGQEVQFIALPYPTPSRYLDEAGQHYRSLEERNRNLEAATLARLQALLDDPNLRPPLPTVLAAHIHVQGAVLSGPFRISEQETILFPDHALPARLAYIALGHIHQPQCLRGLAHVRYSGSIERLDLGEWKDSKSVTLVDIGPEGRRGEPVCLPLEATPIYEVVITNPAEELPSLKEKYPDAGRALVRYDITYTAGRDNLDAILRELDEVFPRCYERIWREAGALREPLTGGLHARLAESSKGFSETILDYLQTELAEDADREAVLELARALLAEEPS
jgi:exonuclease SbcD